MFWKSCVFQSKNKWKKLQNPSKNRYKIEVPKSIGKWCHDHGKRIENGGPGVPKSHQKPFKNALKRQRKKQWNKSLNKSADGPLTGANPEPIPLPNPPPIFSISSLSCHMKRSAQLVPKRTSTKRFPSSADLSACERGQSRRVVKGRQSPPVVPP